MREVGGQRSGQDEVIGAAANGDADSRWRVGRGVGAPFRLGEGAEIGAIGGEGGEEAADGDFDGDCGGARDGDPALAAFDADDEGVSGAAERECEIAVTADDFDRLDARVFQRERDPVVAAAEADGPRDRAADPQCAGRALAADTATGADATWPSRSERRVVVDANPACARTSADVVSTRRSIAPPTISSSALVRPASGIVTTPDASSGSCAAALSARRRSVSARIDSRW